MAVIPNPEGPYRLFFERNRSFYPKVEKKHTTV